MIVFSLPADNGLLSDILSAKGYYTTKRITLRLKYMNNFITLIFYK